MAIDSAFPLTSVKSFLNIFLSKGHFQYMSKRGRGLGTPSTPPLHVPGEEVAKNHRYGVEIGV